MDRIIDLFCSRKCPPSFYLIRGFGSVIVGWGFFDGPCGGMVLGGSRGIVPESGWFCLPGLVIS